jgi:hypothetical protein
MALPTPQFNTPLTPAQLHPELTFHPIYGVTPDNKYTPISITENGQLSIGSVTISGPVTVTDVVIKGVDPDNSFVTEDIDVYNLGVGNGYSMRTTLFDGANHLKINNDGSIDVGFSGSTVITAKIEDTSGNALNSTAGALNVDITNTSLAVTQSGLWSTGRTWSLSSGSDSVSAIQSTSPWVISGTATVSQSTGTNLHTVVDSGSVSATVSGTVTANQGTANVTPWNENIAQIAGSTIATAATGIAKVGLTDGSGNTISSTSNALDVNIKSTTNGASSSSVTSVARSNASQTFLLANTSRKGATLYNDSGAFLYVKFGITASDTDFTVRLASQSYYEVPFSYTGRIDGIWASNGAGDARITELS